MGQQEEIHRSIQSIEVKRQRVVVKDGREKSRDEERRGGKKERERKNFVIKENRAEPPTAGHRERP